MGPALASAERDRLPRRRSLAGRVYMERSGPRASPDAETAVRIARAIFTQATTDNPSGPTGGADLHPPLRCDHM